MHSFYLRSLYIRNELARGELEELACEQLSLGDVKSDSYVVGAVNDHIVPWASSYEATRLLGGTVRYVLSNGGHVAGIVNPPGPKSWYTVSSSPAAYPACVMGRRSGGPRRRPTTGPGGRTGPTGPGRGQAAW